MKKKGKKNRLDNLLQQQKPALSRSRIQSEIMAGKVLVNGIVCDKPGAQIEEEAEIQCLEPENPYVSRGGLKLEGVLIDLALDVGGLIVLDVGASTGGFTDCLLKKGSRLVYALDVGYGQLDYSLRNNPSVVIMERFNVRFLKPEHLLHLPDLAVVDVSFISLTKVLPVLQNMKIPAVLALIKPQFEVGRSDAGKGKGVIRDPELHAAVLKNIVQAAREFGYYSEDMIYSRYPGPKGNLEYFVYFKTRNNQSCLNLEEYDHKIENVVKKAHLAYGKNEN